MENDVSKKMLEQAGNAVNPATLGLCAFGMSTVLLNLHNAGLYEMNAMVMSIGLFFGGFGQLIAGMLEVKNKNVFGLTAFTSYGFFWISLVALLIFPRLGIAVAPSPVAMGSYLVLWGIFTFSLFMATLRINRGLQVVFGLLTLLFILLAAGDFSSSDTVTKLAGYEGIVCGLAAIYVGVSELLHEMDRK